MPRADKLIALSISIHAPRAGSDTDGTTVETELSQFQSTLPVRGATAKFEVWNRVFRISIHAPRAGSDAMVLHIVRRNMRFQSTLPVRGATAKGR